PLFGDDVADDGKNQRAGNAAECSGESACRHQQVIALGEGAEKSSQSKSAIESEESAFPVKAVEKKAGGDPGNPCANGIGGNDETELCRRNREYPHVLRTQRHDDYEVNEGGEVDGGQ